MFAYIVKRLLLVLPTLFVILLVNFMVVQTAPGGPVEQAIFNAQNMGMQATNSDGIALANFDEKFRAQTALSDDLIEKIHQQYGFDKPVSQRFWLMLKNYAVFDFGESFFKSKSVLELIIEKMPVTILLGLWSMLIVYLVAIPLGVFKALHTGSRSDIASNLLLAVMHAIPVLVFAVVLLVLFAGGSYWQIFPLQGLTSDNFEQLSLIGKLQDYFWHLALPVATNVLGGFASLAMLTKYSLLDELSKNYVVTAHAKGLSKNRIVYKHIFKNAMLIVIAGIPSAIFGVFFAGNLLIEIIFNLDGLGLLGFEAIEQRDYPVIFGTLFIFTLFGLLVQLMSDLCYPLLNPTIDFKAR